MTRAEIEQMVKRNLERRAAFRQRQAKKQQAKKEPAAKAAPTAEQNKILKGFFKNSENQTAARPNDDYLQIVKTYQEKNKCSFMEATRAIEKLIPDIDKIKDAWIDQINSIREIKTAQPVMEKAEGKTFPEMVSFLRLNHKMSTSEAHRYIDREYPGLRQYWLDEKNSEGK